MAWTTPKTWSSEPLTSTDLNTYVRDNQLHFHDRLGNQDEHTVNAGSDYTTTSTSFVDVDGTNLSLTLTTHGGDVLVGFAGAVAHDTASHAVYFTISVDGTDYIADDGIIKVHNGDVNRARNTSFVILVTGLSIGSHTFKLRWKVSSGIATLYAGAGTTASDLHPQFWIKEQ